MSGSPEHRRCPMTASYNVIAPARSGATSHLRDEGGLPTLQGPCPFCPGPSLDREPTLQVFPESGPWRVRVLPNKFPAVGTDAERGAHGLPARGRHELVIESPDHDADLVSYDDAQVSLLFRALRDRVRAMEADDAIAHVTVFRNRGRRSGASQPHPHVQIVGTVVPGPEQVTRLEAALRFHARTGTDLATDLVRRELGDGARLVSRTRGILSLAAFAPRRTGEVWIVPEVPRGSLSRFDDAELDALAIATRGLARVVLDVTGRAAYNVIVRSLPIAYRDHAAAFTYVEIIPRGGVLAGFEMATGSGLVSMTPESLAERLRARQ